MNNAPHNVPDHHPWLVAAVADGDKPVRYGVINPNEHDVTGDHATVADAEADARARKAHLAHVLERNAAFQVYQEGRNAPTAPATPTQPPVKIYG